MKLLTIIFILVLHTFTISYSNIYTYSKRVAKNYKIPHEIVLAVIRAESDFNQEAVSYKNAYGLMQITSIAYKHFTWKNPKTTKNWISNFDVIKKDWRANISVGTWLLKRVCYAKHGNWKDAITSFFWGVNHPKPTYKYYATVVRKSNLKLPIPD